MPLLYAVVARGSCVLAEHRYDGIRVLKNLVEWLSFSRRTMIRHAAIKRTSTVEAEAIQLAYLVALTYGCSTQLPSAKVGIVLFHRMLGRLFITVRVTSSNTTKKSVHNKNPTTQLSFLLLLWSSRWARNCYSLLFVSIFSDFFRFCQYFLPVP